MKKWINPLDLPALNVVVVGAGGIAQALIAELLGRYRVGRMFVLRRTIDTAFVDERVVQLAVDAREPESLQLAANLISQQVSELHLVVNTVGVLHNAGMQPEKRLTDVKLANLMEAMLVNGLYSIQLAQALAELIRRSEASVFASLSARVGSIADNGKGGWYSYRASKAAHNMLLKTLANEWRFSHRNTCVVALHPGTVATSLSAPFLPANYKNRVLLPKESAVCLLEVIAGLSPQETGCFRDWRGDIVPW